MEFKINFIFITCIIIAVMFIFSVILAVRDSIKQIKQEKAKEKEERKPDDDIAKQFAFHVESYLVYHDDDDKLTKKEILVLLGEILRQEYKIDTVKDLVLTNYALKKKDKE